MTDPGVKSATGGQLKSCAACGSRNPDGARFCAQCGVILPSVPTTSSGAAALLAEARLHNDAGAWEEAALAGEAVLALDPDSAEAHHHIARARLHQGMRTVAHMHAQEALRLEPTNPEYQADLLRLESHETVGPPRWVPLAVASVISVLVLAVIMTIAFANRARNQLAIEPVQPGDSSATFTPRPPSPSVYPQPIRPQGTVVNRPRTPAPRASAQPPGPATRQAQGTSPGTPMPSMIPPSRSPIGLAPAPVDSSALRPFESSQDNSSAMPRAARTSQNEPVQPLAPAPQPGGTNFGPGYASPQPYSPPATLVSPPVQTPPQDVSTEPAPAAPPRALPQQQYVQRDYAGAIQGYQNVIAQGMATGATYQQLALSYERAGQAAEAANAYQQAIEAYQAQISAGQDVDVARRGLRASQRSLSIIQNRTR